MNPKIQWLRNTMSSLNLQGLIISNPINIKYLTNIDAEGILLLTRKDNIFITDGRYIEHVHSILTLYDEIIVYDINGLSKDDYENFFIFCENVGFEENYVTYAGYKELIRKYKINQYTKADEYEVKSEKIASVKSVVGERKIKTYSKSNQGVQILKLTFIDNDSENTVKEYMNYLKDNGNYIEMNMSESNKRKIANPSKELITVETEIIEGGFILTIEVGPGSIKVNNPE